MHLSIRLVGAAVLSIAASAVLAQENAVVLFDATKKTTFCVVPDIDKIIVPPPGTIAPTDTHKVDVSKRTAQKPCADLTDKGFLVQGQRNQLRVINRKFLTNYTFFIDKVTQVQNFPIEDLNEAANLTTPLSNAAAGVSKGAAPKGLATTGALALRTAQDLIAELLNPATTSNPPNEIASDWLVVKREADNVRADAIAFQATWMGIQGPAVVPSVVLPNDRACRPAYGAPTLNSVTACLNAQWAFETTDSFNEALPTYSDEDQFRKLIVRDNDAIAMMTLMGNVLTQQTALLTSQLSAFDGDLASLRADLNTLAGNVQAIQDALALLDSITPAMTKAQIKAKLAQTLNGGTKPVLDDAELNLLTGNYYAFTRSPAGVEAIRRTRAALNLIWLEGTRQTERALQSVTALTPDLPQDGDCANDANGIRLGCLADNIAVRYSILLERDHTSLGQYLPTQVAQINMNQSRLLARANEIYDNSQMTVPLDKAIDLGGNSGNLRVYFTIYETELFPRFAIPANSSSASPVITATPAAIAAPPAPAATTTATTTTTTTTTTPAPAPPSGTPVTSGQLEVHDLYKATIVAAFAFSTVHETSITTNTVSTGTATGSTTANPLSCTATATCTQVTVSPGPIHSSVILGMSFHPWGYDTFHDAYSHNKPSVILKHGFGIFGGLSVQNLNDYYGGADLQFAHGLQIMSGINFYRQNTLAAGFTSGGIYPGSPTFTGPQQWSHGAYFGIGLNLSIFRKAFGSVTGLGTSVASSGT